MPFIKLEKRVGIQETKLGASISMRIYKGSPKPITFISLRRQFLDATNIGKTMQFDIAVGEGGDAGKIRITPNAKSGIFVARSLKSGTLILDLGHLPQLGIEEHRNHSAAVEFIDGAAVLTVPDWTEESDDDDEENDRPAPSVASKPKVETASKNKPPSSSASKPKAVIVAGITINQTPGCEAISYRSETIEVSARGALLVESLARTMPNCVGDGFLIGKLWNPKPANAATLLDMVVRDLSSLKKLGLEVRTQRGIGRQLVEAK